MNSADSIGTQMTVHYDPETNSDLLRISHLEPSHLRRIIAVVMKRCSGFRCAPMSGGKWVMYTGVGVLSVSDVAKVTGSVVGGKV